MSRMSAKQREALRLLREHGDTYTGDSDRFGVVTSGPTRLSSGQPWINWRTADALSARGLVEIQGWGEETEIILRGTEENTG